MKNWLKAHGMLLATAILLYGVALIYQGYTYGSGDQSQILPVLKARDHPGLYPHDQYVQAYLHAGINERTVFQFLWRWLGYANPWIVFLFHAAASLALIAALLQISGLFLQRVFWQTLFVGVVLTLAMHVSTGGNELYYGSFIPSLPAKALAAWAIYAWLRRRYLRWAVLLAIAGLLQPLVGFQVFLLTSAAECIRTIRKRSWREFPWQAILLYLIVTAPWLVLLVMSNGAEGHPAEFLEIMAFRLSHHFFPGTWPWTSFLVTGILAVWAISVWPDKLRDFLVLVVVGCVVYMLMLRVSPRPVILYTQWFKTTIWLEAFGILAMARTAERLTLHWRWLRPAGWFVAVMLLLGVGLYRLSGWLGEPAEYVFPWSRKVSAEIRISRRAAELTDPDAVFVVPYRFTAFRWYGERSLYVDYKAMLHQYDFLAEWYRRIQAIYQYGRTEQEAGFGFSNFADAVFDHPAYESLALWQRLGITHFISRAPKVDELEPIASEPPYYLYAIPQRE